MSFLLIIRLVPQKSWTVVVDSNHNCSGIFGELYYKIFSKMKE